MNNENETKNDEVFTIDKNNQVQNGSNRNCYLTLSKTSLTRILTIVLALVLAAGIFGAFKMITPTLFQQEIYGQQTEGKTFSESPANTIPGRWSIKKAQIWYDKLEVWRHGPNFIPSNAVNQLEFWQKETFDPAIIRNILTDCEKLFDNKIMI